MTGAFADWWTAGYPLVVTWCVLFSGMLLSVFLGWVCDIIPPEIKDRRVRYVFKKKYMATFTSILFMLSWLGLTITMLIWERI